MTDFDDEFKTERADITKLKFLTLRDLLEQKGGRKTVGELARRIRLRGVWAYDEFEGYLEVLPESKQAEKARQLLADIQSYDRDAFGADVAWHREHMEPLLDHDGEHDGYSKYGWPREEFEIPLREIEPKQSLEKSFAEQLHNLLGTLEDMLAYSGHHWDRKAAVPGTVAELYAFAAWTEIKLVEDRGLDSFRKNCKGLVKFKTGRPRKDDDEPSSPLGRLLKENGRCVD